MTSQNLEATHSGELKIAWAERHSPVLAEVARDYWTDGSFDGLRIGVGLPIEPKTALLCVMLRRVGAEVVIDGTEPSRLHADVAAALQSHGVVVAGFEPGSDGDEEGLSAVFDPPPDLLIDDGGYLGAYLHSARRDALETLRGVSEETTTGVRRYDRLHSQGLLKVPVYCANDARVKYLFDNRYGTGQSGLTSLLGATNLMLPGKRLLIVGYGWVGKGVARFAAAMGARVLIAEVDPVRGLEAFADGHIVLPLMEALPEAEIVIMASGTPGALNRDHFSRLRDGAVVVSVGGCEREIHVEALAELATERRLVRPFVEEFTFSDGRRVCLLGEGRAAFNCTDAAEGHPIEIMDLTFSIQALCIHALARNAGDMAPGLHAVPSEFDEIVARAKLRSVGMGVDELTPEQVAALAGWEDD